VVAPYANRARGDCRFLPCVPNLTRLAGEGALGRYGYYEAARLPPGARCPKWSRFAIFYSFIGASPGMTFVALSGRALHGDIPSALHAEHDQERSCCCRNATARCDVVVSVYPRARHRPVESTRVCTDGSPVHPLPHTPTPDALLSTALHVSCRPRFRYSRLSELSGDALARNPTRDNVGRGRCTCATSTPAVFVCGINRDPVRLSRTTSRSPKIAAHQRGATDDV